MMLQLCLEFSLSSLTINSHWGRERRKETRDKTKMTPIIILVPNSLVAEQNRLEFHILTDQTVNIQVKLDLFVWAPFFQFVLKLFLDAAFRSICDYTRLDQKCF